uniref:C2H2-type domain-containing protein n=1 Tax=Romanomermis culicivorax TaxID=13658 RepID=A0A915HIT5_ROMCU
MPVRVKDSLQNLQWMRSFNLRWRHSFLRYSVAKTRDSMLVTHSTYWKYAQQQMQLQQIQSKSARKHCHEHSPQSEIQNSTLHTLAKKPKIEQTLLIPSHQRSSLIDTPSRLLSQVENNSIVRGSCEGEAGAANVSFSPSNDPKNVAQHCSQNQGRRIFQRCTKRNSEDSDETMSNDGLCVVTDDEDEKCQPGQKTSHLIRELRQGLLTFSRLWARLLEDRCNERLICQTPAFSDHHSVDFQHNNHDIIRCSSAPPIFFGQLPSAFLVDHSIAVNRKLVLDPRTNHSSISSTSGSSFSAQDCRSEDVKGSNFNASVTGDTDKMEVITDSGISDISTPTDSRITPISTGGTSCNICEFCGQKFEKFSLFVLHRSVHSINRNAHKRYEYRCPYCSSNQRSRNLLQRHIATAHQRLCSQYANASTLRSENELAVSGNKVLPNTTTSGEHRSTISANNRTTFNSGQQQQQTSSQTVFNNGVTSRINNQPLSNDPRPFKCHYCEIAFRIHGHLAKHLRSKAHVMKLEALSLVPPGALSVLEEGDRLSQIDTSDCENSLRSLLKLMEKLNNGNSASKKKTPPTAAPIPPTPAVLSLHSTTDNNKNDAPHQPSLDQILQPASDLSSLACTESFSVATSPLQDATEKSNGGGTKRSITASGVWMPPKDVSLPITVPVSPFDSSNSSDQLVNSAVINNGHLGSMAAISSQILDVQTSVLTPTPGVDASANLAFPCCICDGRFYSQLDLDVHYHADHVVMRDGSFFKCPAKDCDTVYPTRLNLRNHLILHYTGRLPCSASNSGFVSSPGENGNGCSTTAAAGATPSTPETTTNSSLVSTISAADRTDVSRSTVAALNRKLLSGHGEMGDSNGLNGNGSRKIHCSRSSSAKSHCDCQKCIKQQTDNVDNSPPPDSDASRLSASSRSHSPTPPSRPASKRSLTTTPASFSSSSMNNLQISGGNGAATSSSMYNDSNTSMSAFVGGASKR